MITTRKNAWAATEISDGDRKMRSNSTIRELIVFVVVFVAATLSPPVADACSMVQGWRPRSNVEMIIDAKEVLFVTVRRIVPDPAFDYGAGTTVYTAEVDVHCILKGQQTDARINITKAGHVPGWCHSTNLTVNHRYVLLVGRDGEEFVTASAQMHADTDDMIAPLVQACDLQQLYPKGVNSATVNVKCPVPAPPGKCKRKADFEEPASKEHQPPAFTEVDSEYYDSEPGTLRASESKQSDSSRGGCTWIHSSVSATILFTVLTHYIVSRIEL